MVIEVEDSLVERFQRDGAVLVEGAFDETWVQKVRRGIAQNLERPSKYSERLTVSLERQRLIFALADGRDA